MRTWQLSLLIAGVCFGCGSRFESIDGTGGSGNADSGGSSDAGASAAGEGLGANAGSGATDSGGAGSAGAATGGSAQGGAAHGGSGHGGAAHGGAANGGAANGGSPSGGAGVGGASHGGSANGGAGVGGASGGASGSGVGGSGGADCTMLRNAYLADLDKARICEPAVAGECSSSSTLPGACGCPVFVNSKSKYTEMARTDQKAIDASGCHYAVCGVACVAFPGVACSPDSASATMSYVCTGTATAN